VLLCPVPGSAEKSSVEPGAEDGGRETWPGAALTAPSRLETPSPAWLQGGAALAVSRGLVAVPAVPDLSALGVSMAAFAAAFAELAERVAAAFVPLGAALAQLGATGAALELPGPRGTSGDPCGDPPHGWSPAARLEPPSASRRETPVKRRPMENVWRPREGFVKGRR